MNNKKSGGGITAKIFFLASPTEFMYRYFSLCIYVEYCSSNNSERKYVFFIEIEQLQCIAFPQL